MRLIRPTEAHLASYAAALERGWSPDNLRPEAVQDQLARIADDPLLFLDELDDRDARGPRIVLPDGRRVPRLPGYVRWLWDGEFCGSIGFRWQPGTTELPPYCLGHIGYAVVPWKRRRGYATQALAQLLPEVCKEGLTFVELVTEAANVASQRVIESNGGKVVARFTDPAVHDGRENLKYRIYLMRTKDGTADKHGLPAESR